MTILRGQIWVFLPFFWVMFDAIFLQVVKELLIGEQKTKIRVEMLVLMDKQFSNYGCFKRPKMHTSPTCHSISQYEGLIWRGGRADYRLDMSPKMGTFFPFLRSKLTHISDHLRLDFSQNCFWEISLQNCFWGKPLKSSALTEKQFSNYDLC